MTKRNIKRKNGGKLLAPTNNLTKKELIQLLSQESKMYLYETKDFYEAFCRVLHDQIILGKTVHLEGICKFRHRINPPRYLKNKQREVYLSKGSRTVKVVLNEELQQATKEYYQENVLPFIEMIDVPVNPFVEPKVLPE
jgi:nucleoid DNA-binding protein